MQVSMSLSPMLANDMPPDRKYNSRNLGSKGGFNELKAFHAICSYNLIYRTYQKGQFENFLQKKIAHLCDFKAQFQEIILSG
jgi:hypothetical protein